MYSTPIRIVRIETNDKKKYLAEEGVDGIINNLEKELEAEREAHKKTQKKFEDFKSLNQERIVKRIMLNLSEGVLPMASRTSFGAVQEKFDKNESVLAHSLRFAHKVDEAGNDHYPFSDEVAFRIRQALNGLKNSGEEYK